MSEKVISSFIQIGELLNESRVELEKDDPSKRISVKLHLEGVEKRGERGNDGVGATKYFKRFAGQFIYGKQNLHNGALGIIPKELDGFSSSQDIPTFDFNEDKVFPKYFYYYLSNPFYYKSLERISTGTGSKRIQPSELFQQTIILPKIPVQKKISEILESVDRVIDLTAMEIKKLKDIKSGLMHELFTKGIGHSKFKDSSIGKIPVSWKTITLAETVIKNAPICYGVLMPGNHVDGGIPIIKVKNIRNNLIEKYDLLLCSPEIESKFSRSRLKQGDILLTIRGTTGRLAIVPESLEGANITQDSARIRINEEVVDSSYVFFCLLSSIVQKQVEDNTIGQAVKGINLEEVRKLVLPVPGTRKEQTIIANSISSINKRILIQLEKHEQVIKLKNGLMIDLLSGKLKVTI